jgi:hypothetical protein
MEKTFTINIPDQLWVDNWEKEKTETYTYRGPAEFNILVETTGNWEIVDWSDSEFDRETNENETIVKLTVTDDNIAAAHYIVTRDEEFEYIYEDIINHDGSIHREISNPRLQDYFDLEYRPSSGFSLSTITKETETENERTAQKRLQYVEKYNEVYDFDEEIQTIIDKFLSDVQSFLEFMQTVYPWRYVTIDPNEVPKIPARLVTEFNKLPDLN